MFKQLAIIGRLMVEDMRKFLSSWLIVGQFTFEATQRPDPDKQLIVHGTFESSSLPRTATGPCCGWAPHAIVTYESIS